MVSSHGMWAVPHTVRPERISCGSRGRTRHAPPKGPNSFISTHKFYKTQFHLELVSPP